MSKKNKNRKAKIGLPPETLVYTGDREATASLTRTLVYNAHRIENFETYTPEKADSEHNIWIDVRNISDIDFIRSIGEHFDIHPLALEDVVNTNQRAKLDEYDNGLFVVIQNLHYDERWSELRFEQISMFVAKNTLITFQEDPDDTLKFLVQRLLENSGKARKKGSDYLAYATMDAIVDNYFLALDEIETTMYEMENSIYNHDVHPHFKSKIFNIKHILNQFRHKVQPLRDAIARMHRSDCPFLVEADMVYLRDVADHVAQVLDQIESFKDQLINMEALYQGEINNRMNNVMKLLTVISTIFIPLSFVAGVYGMNFENMPELKWHYGYYAVLAFMVVSAASMLVWFRIKKWI